MDLTAATATRTVTFTYPSYTPKCAKIKAGQSVTFSGDFSAHPLTAGTVSSGTATPQSGSPITNGTGTSATFAFPTAGTFPYYCGVHFSAGMTGAIYVVP